MQDFNEITLLRLKSAANLVRELKDPCISLTVQEEGIRVRAVIPSQYLDLSYIVPWIEIKQGVNCPIKAKVLKIYESLSRKV